MAAIYYWPLTALCWVALLSLSFGCASPAGPSGYLEGTVTIGPLRPVEPADRPPPTPPPELCRRQTFRVLDETSRTERLTFTADAACRFRVELAPGRYLLEYAGSRPAFTKDLTKVVEIRAGDTTRVDVHIDTGIR